VPLRFADWNEAVTFLYASPELRAAVVVIDEFPYLSDVETALPSILQREIDRGASRQAGPSLLLCGSALSVMGRLLAGGPPLRGRANLELVVRPFDYRLAARYWRITDPRLAVHTHAVVGGTPAYRAYLSDDLPRNQADFDDWVLRTVLNPATPLFRDARYQLAEEVAGLRETSLYHSVLAAVAAGNNTRGGIATHVGRKATDLTHYLNVWEDTGLLVREEDMFRSGRSRYRIAEPLITFYEVVCRPQWGRLEAGRAEAVWADARPRFTAQGARTALREPVPPVGGARRARCVRRAAGRGGRPAWLPTRPAGPRFRSMSPSSLHLLQRRRLRRTAPSRGHQRRPDPASRAGGPVCAGPRHRALTAWQLGQLGGDLGRVRGAGHLSPDLGRRDRQ
jgi:hypothetical protein